MSELGDRLRSMAILADDHPEWTGVGFIAHVETVSMHVHCTEKEGDLGAALLARALSAMTTDMARDDV